ncbi:RidA family protein [Lentisalinibacter orientalis]|uniref:RidA family protein n=1 Tax=Lentisalinibacter orientalis TaxID=2992241 RepID=UPI0038641290
MRPVTTIGTRIVTNKVVAAVMLLAAGLAQAGDRIQHPLPDNSTFPIARAVEVSADATLVWHSGMVPRPANPDAERNSPEYWGDTEAQALSVFARMEESLDDLGLGFGDIVKMTVFLVEPPGEDGMDFQGFMRAYTRYFGAEAEQMNLPARSAVEVAGLVAPGMLVEVEAVFVRP